MNELLNKILSLLQKALRTQNNNQISLELLTNLITKTNLWNDVKVETGATRICLILNEFDYVVKLPRFDLVKEDFCDREVARYEDAQVYKVDKVLQPIHLLKMLTAPDNSEFPVYIQQKYSSCYAKMQQQFEEKYYKPYITQDILNYIIKSQNEYWSELAFGFEFRIIQLYGKKFYERFLNFCQMNDITDLHYYNYGFNLRGEPVIFDYAGFEGYSY